jgi:hypothetical protein
MKIGLLSDALEPGIHCVRAHWIRGFIGVLTGPEQANVRLMVSASPESGFLGRPARPPLRTDEC